MGKSRKIAGNEIILYEHFDSTIVITDKKIRRKHSPNKDSLCYSNMRLKDITSIDVRNDDKPWVLAVGVMSVIAGISGLLEFQAWGLGSLLAGIALVIFFFGSRDHVIEFRWPEITVKLSTRYMENGETMDLINKIVQLKTE